MSRDRDAESGGDGVYMRVSGERGVVLCAVVLCVAVSEIRCLSKKAHQADLRYYRLFL